MSDVAIRAEGLGKSYAIAHRRQQGAGYKTLQEDLRAALHWPLARLRGEKSTERETFWALRDISFEVKHGEVLGIIGRNGAGKSTLLKILSRITEPSAGHADIFGRIGSLLEVGTGFHPELTGRENIFLNGAILGMSRREIARKFDDIVAFAEIEQFLDTPVKRYSSGMYMRLAFAVAAHLESEILVVDEVLAVGDAAFQKKCLGKMQDVARDGRTVLFVSHEMNAVERLCTKGLLLEHGKVKRFSADVRSLIRDYLSQEAAAARWVGEESATSRRFESHWIKPLGFAVTDRDGHPLAAATSNNADVYVQIEAEIKEMDPALNLGYALYNDDGELLYWSCTTDESEESWPTLSVGRQTVRSMIPKRFLNEGTYRLDLIVSLHFRQWLCEPGRQSPSIYLQIQGGLSDSPYWMAKRPGALAPVLHWEQFPGV